MEKDRASDSLGAQVGLGGAVGGQQSPLLSPQWGVGCEAGLQAPGQCGNSNSQARQGKARVPGLTPPPCCHEERPRVKWLLKNIHSVYTYINTVSFTLGSLAIFFLCFRNLKSLSRSCKNQWKRFSEG